MTVVPSRPTSSHAVELDAVTHRFGNVVALHELSLVVRAGEFLTLLGPSGCGKTTLLRIVAGFERPWSGRVRVDGTDLTDVAAFRRPVNMVFQRPSLFPHLDVFENVAFGLRLAHVSQRQVELRVSELLALVRLEGYARRRAHELSGGQMQRVALARSLAKRPRVLLLDEPLSALDLRIRLEMEAELRRVHRESGAAFVYVTHDQREALALSDRIAVLDGGRIEQLATAREIYARPASPFVARFVGNANVLPVDVVASDGDGATVVCAGATLELRSAERPVPGPAWLILRPEATRLAAPVDGRLVGSVEDVAFRGTGFTCSIAIDGLEQPLKAEVAAGSGPAVEVGARVGVTWDAHGASLLPRDGPTKSTATPEHV